MFREMNRARRPLPLLPGLLLLAPVFAAPVERPGIERDAEIVSVSGEGWVRFPGAPDWLGAAGAQALTAGDTLRTGAFGRMGVLFVDGVQLKLGRTTTLEVREVATRAGAATTTLSLQRGEIWSRAKAAPGGVRVQTPSATAAIRGTDWDLVVDEKGTSFLTVLRGRIEFSNTSGSLLVGEGEQAVAEVGKAPVRTFVVQPRERVQWVFSHPLDVSRLVPFATASKPAAVAALEAARARIAAAPADRAVRLALAGALFDAGEEAAGATAFDALLADDPRDVRALAFRGLLALRAGTTDEAEVFFDRAIDAAALRPAEALEARLGLVGVLAHQGRLERAVAEVEALAARPDAPPVVGIVTAHVRAFTGDFVGALALADAFAGRFPGDARFPLLRSGLRLVLDDPPGAEAEARAALALDPALAPAHTALGQVRLLEGRGAGAGAAFEAALALDPAEAVARNGLALLLAERGHFHEALAAFTAALEDAPDAAVLWANRGLTHALVERLAAARADFDRARALDPAQSLALTGAALVAMKEGRPAVALDLALRASLHEPRLARPHALAAIAHYQRGERVRALQSLELASQLDPNDPYPHLVAYLIHQDSYRPFAAVAEARKVLERLPYLKSVDALETTRQGLANLGSALLGFGLDEWAESYAQESYNPHASSSHFQSARRYNTNRGASVSELAQGLLLDPLANSQPTRHLDLVRRPRTNLSLSGTWTDTGAGTSSGIGAVAQGYARLPWELAWSVAAQGSDARGDGVNDEARGGSLAVGLGLVPSYNHGFNLGFALGADRGGLPGSASAPDPDDTLRTRDLTVDLGYRLRFGPRNHLLVRAVFGRTTRDFTNPSPFGTGLTDLQATFLAAGYGIDETRGFFERGVFDISTLLGGPARSLATDATGLVAANPASVRLPGGWPAVIDTDLRAQDLRREITRGFQVRHLVALGERHEFTWGLDHAPGSTRTLERFNAFAPVGVIEFYEEPILDPAGFVFTFPELASSAVVERATDDWRFLSAYVGDRWKPARSLLVETNVFLETFRDAFNRDERLLPRLGVAWEFARGHLLRAGVQGLVEKPSLGSLAPVATAGLLGDDTQSLPGGRTWDHQVRWEARWTERFFTAVGLERADTEDPELGPGFTEREFRVERASVALNAIVAEPLAAFARASFASGRVTGGGFSGLDLPRLPERSASVGLVWTSPREFSVTLTHVHTGAQTSGFVAPARIPSFWATNLSGGWELLDRRLRLGGSIGNVFNTGAPAAGRSASLSVEGRF